MDEFLTHQDPKSLALFAIIAVWTVFWKGLALWQASRRDNRVWFVILLIVSTFGILEIIYLFFVLKMKPGELMSSGKHVEVKDEEKEEDGEIK